MITNINPTGGCVVLSKYQEQHGENVSIGLTGSAESAINWAMMKMAEEKRIKELAKTNATIKDAADNLARAQEQLEIILALTDKEI